METAYLINDEIPRPRRPNSRHHRNLSLGALSFEDESEEAQNATHYRKSSDYSHGLSWTMSGDSSMYQEDLEEVGQEDEREDARGRLVSEGDVGRERLLSEDGNFFDEQFSTPVQPDLQMYLPSFLLTEQIEGGRHIAAPSVMRIQDQKASCFRSCPRVPVSNSDIPIGSDRLDLSIRRTRAFSEDDEDMSSHWTSSVADSYGDDSEVQNYSSSTSMLIDAKYAAGSYYQEDSSQSPTTVWVYWEDNLNSSVPSSPFAHSLNNNEQPF